jgi:hypothetical protein
VNLAGKRPDILREMESRLESHRSRVAVPRVA